MQQIQIEIQADFLQRLVTTRPVQALVELIWNSLDAEAKDVRVEFDRDPAERLVSIRVVDDGPAERLCIIIDDVSTSGAHFQAAEALMSREAAAVTLALAVGQTVHDPVEDPFAWVETELPLYKPE